MVDIHPPDSKPYGLTYEEHIIKDWKRNLSAPSDKSPMEDKTGQNAGYGLESDSPVIYLSGNTGGSTERNIKIPSGKGIFISVNDVVASEAEKPGTTVEDLHSLAKDDQDSASDAYLRINDKEFNFEDLKAYRFHTKPFDVVFPTTNALWDARAGPSKAVADGHYVITKPLSPGKYSIVTKATVEKPFGKISGPWVSEARYNLEVT